jgi:hypothetical protein
MAASVYGLSKDDHLKCVFGDDHHGGVLEKYRNEQCLIARCFAVEQFMGLSKKAGFLGV